MSTKQRDPLTPFVGPGAEAFKLWISFWPVAPLFGVEWRFAETMGQPKTAKSEGKSKDASKARSSAGSASKTAPASKQTDTSGGTASVVALKPGVVSEKVAPAESETQAPAPKKSPEAKIAEKPAAAEKPEPAPAPKAAEQKPAAAPAPKAAEQKPAAAPEPESATSKPQDSAAGSETDAGKKPTNLMSESPATPDDLKMIRGVGPGLESKLNALGIYTFDQIAEFSDDNLVWVDENLTAFKGRCFRDDWIGQAKSLRG